MPHTEEGRAGAPPRGRASFRTPIPILREPAGWIFCSSEPDSPHLAHGVKVSQRFCPSLHGRCDSVPVTSGLTSGLWRIAHCEVPIQVTQ